MFSFSRKNRQNDITLEKVCTDLYNQWNKTNENHDDTTHLEADIDKYFHELALREEISNGKVNLGLYGSLSETVKKEILPHFKDYLEIKKEVTEKTSKRSLKKYVLWTVGTAEAIEFVMSLGGSLNPAFLLPTLVMEAGLGCAIYKCIGMKDYSKINDAKKQLFSTIKDISEKKKLETKYDKYQQDSKGKILGADIYELLSQYESQSQFWSDYKKVRATNPKDKNTIDNLNYPKFSKFLEPHTLADATPESIEYRFNELFIKAHEYFLKKDKNEYVLRNLDIVQ